MSQDKTECCPKFDPTPWDEKTHEWKDKKFIKDKVWSIFYMPINMGSVIGRMWKKVEGTKAELPAENFMILSKDLSPWRSEQYMAVADKVEGAENVEMSGTFLTKVFEGPYKEAKNWVKEMENYVASQDKDLKDLFFYYTTCPKCAKKYGKNYVVAFAKVG